MDRNDWIDLLALAYTETDGIVAGGCTCKECGDALALEMLHARVPALCPDCKGQGVINLPEYEGNLPTCVHPSAPTVEQVLAAGMRVYQADTRGNVGNRVWVDGVVQGTAYDLLAALRGEDQ